MNEHEGEDFAAEKAAFFLRMRARGIQDLAVLRAFELLPRSLFVEAPFQAIASRDVPLPLPCGQTMPEPWLLGRMIEALRLIPSHHVLEIGAGSGYATAILATLANDVIGIERFQMLVRAAQTRLAEREIVNAAIVWGDGLALPAKAGPFDRIIAHGIIDEPESLVARLTPEGRLVCALRLAGAVQVVAIDRAKGVEAPTVICPCALAPIVSGPAAIL